MNRISSRSTFFDKFVFPTVWLGGVFAFAGFSVSSGAVAKDPIALLVPVFMLIAGYFTMKRFVWDLVDQVLDEGDKLIVTNAGVEALILLENIMNVSSSLYTRPPRITLRLINPCRFGREVVFKPANNRIAEDLIVRVHRAKFPPPE